MGLPYNTYLAHGALSKLKFPIGNIYCIIPKKRTPQPLQLIIIITFCYNLETNIKICQNSKISLMRIQKN